MLLHISIWRKGWRTVANSYEMFASRASVPPRLGISFEVMTGNPIRVGLRRPWRDMWHKIRAALRGRPVDPLASLVETARRLDYGAGWLQRDEGDEA